MLNNTKAVNLYPKPNKGFPLITLAVSTTPVSPATLDVTTYYVLVEVQGNSVYATFDGSTPSSTNGHIYAAGYRDFWSRQMIDAATFLQNSGAAKIVMSPFAD
jgi:hypothetical protein